MRLTMKIIVGAAIVAATVAAATFSASAPAAASERVAPAPAADTQAALSARKKVRHKPGTSLRVVKLSRPAAAPPNKNRRYYHPVPHFFPFAQDRGYF